MQKTFNWQGKILRLNMQDCGIRICIFFLVKKLESGKEKENHIVHLSFLGILVRFPQGVYTLWCSLYESKNPINFHLIFLVLLLLNDYSKQLALGYESGFLGGCCLPTGSELGLNSVEGFALAVKAEEPPATSVPSGQAVCDVGPAILSSPVLGW